MAGKDIEYDAQYGVTGTAHARERGIWTEGTPIFVDPSKPEREKGQKHWSLGLGLAGKM